MQKFPPVLADVFAYTRYDSSNASSQVFSLTFSNTQNKVTWVPYPSAQQYSILSASNLGGAFAADLSGRIAGTTWTAPSTSNNHGFYRLAVSPMTSNDVLTANVLNRLAYGPTPDELERVTSIGP